MTNSFLFAILFKIRDNFSRVILIHFMLHTKLRIIFDVLVADIIEVDRLH